MPYDAVSKAEAKKVVRKIRAKTKCERCGGQPIEWHRECHIENSNWRVSHLVALGFPIKRILDEIKECNALCRSCHMKEDGRLEKLQNNKPRQKGKVYVGPKPCVDCGKLAKPLRRGLCNRCNHRQRYRPVFKD